MSAPDPSMYPNQTALNGPPPYSAVTKLQPREQAYERFNYSDHYSGIEILSALFRDIYTTGRPSPALGIMLSPYAVLRLGGSSDMTNAVPIVNIGDEDYQTPIESSGKDYYGRGRTYRPPYSQYGAQKVTTAPNKAWIRALSWEKRTTKMISLAPGSLRYISQADQTVDFILGLAREWSTYSSITLPHVGQLMAYYQRTGPDVIFRLTTHKAHSFTSVYIPKVDPKDPKNFDPLPYYGYPGGAAGAYPPAPKAGGLLLPNNVLHVVSIWDTNQRKWLLSGFFLCPEGHAVNGDAWSMTAKIADEKYTRSLAHRLPSEQRVYTRIKPTIIVSAPSAPTSVHNSAELFYSSITAKDSAASPEGLGLLPAVSITDEEAENEPFDEDNSETEDDDENFGQVGYGGDMYETPPSKLEPDESPESSPSIDNRRAISPGRFVRLQDLGDESLDGLSKKTSYYMDPPVARNVVPETPQRVNTPLLGPKLTSIQPVVQPPESRSTTPVWPGAFPREKPAQVVQVEEPAPPVAVAASRDNTVVIQISPEPIPKAIPKLSPSPAKTKTAVEDHLNSSVVNLAKLAKSQGMNLTEFMSMVLDAADTAFR